MQMKASEEFPNYLDGLPLGSAVRKFVLEDKEIVDLGRLISAVNPGHSAVFLEGQFPGAFVNFCWPLRASAETIADAFVHLPIIIPGKPLPSPSIREMAVSLKLAERLASIADYLAAGDLIALGTFAASGMECTIGAGQWTRRDLLIDVQNSAVCELRDHRVVAIWTGVCLRRANHTLPEELRFVSAAEGKAENKAAKQIQTKDKSRRECRQWLSGLMSDSNIEPLTKEQIWKIAKTKWPDSLSEREFVRCRDGVLCDLSDEQRYLWKRPGPRSKRK